MIQIALYGKGGIGKSTVAANLSAALARAGKRVLQVGCDPKRDSTRLLLAGSSAPPVLDYIRNVPERERHLEDIMMTGSFGVSCVEAGGPEPGVGCAGRGIISTFELLESLGIRQIPFDVVIYDVLGDVVCGGFAVPLRKGYADAVILVTSGEYMSLYAANNILKGVANSSNAQPRVLGLIHNGRGLSDEVLRVTSFAKATGLPIIASIPRDNRFAEAEKAGCTIAEAFPQTELSGSFSDLSTYIMGIRSGVSPLNPAQPLDDQVLEQRVLGRITARIRTATPRPMVFLPPQSPEPAHQPVNPGSCPDRGVTPILRGCAFAGAIRALTQVDGALVVAHAPRSCTHIVSHFLTSAVLRRLEACGGTATPFVLPSFVSTDMDEDSAIFGGRELLERTLLSVAGQGCDTVFVVTSCTPGIIGDDTDSAARAVMNRYPGLNVFCLPAGGNLSGDFSAGSDEACRLVSHLIDPTISQQVGWVNIVGEISIVSNSERNYQTINTLLNRLGLQVNCRFLTRTSLDAVRSFKKASLCLPANDNEATLQIQTDLQRKFGMEFFPHPFPVGFHETARWTTALAHWCGREEEAARIITGARQHYWQQISCARKHLQGRRLIVVTDRESMGWVSDLGGDLGMVIPRIYLMNNPGKSFSGDITGSDLPVFRFTTLQSVSEEIAKTQPDLVLSTIPLPEMPGVRHDMLPLHPDVGFMAGLPLAYRWSHIIRLPAVDGWRRYGGCSP